MWGTQALPKVCLHLACFAAVAHWGGDRPCDVRNVNGPQVRTACRLPALLAPSASSILRALGPPSPDTPALASFLSPLPVETP